MILLALLESDAIVIAGVEKPNTGSVDKKIKIAYKPQYLTNDIDVEVISVLEKANGTTIEGSVEEEQILDPLKLKKLYADFLILMIGIYLKTLLNIYLIFNYL